MAKFVSYAPNFEDVMLWRALRHVEKGCYVDIGANHPVCDSVTRAFYDRGWCGINIEPLPFLYGLLVADRPRDINLRCAVSSNSGRATFHEIAGTGLSTLEPDIAEAHAARGHVVQSLEVPVMTLGDVFAAHPVGEIHFLKIDVEGAEEKVLRGMPFEHPRPWIVVVEATEPNTQVPSHQPWEALLLDRGYTFVYFDGANRFYVSREHAELADAFRIPPNVFDDFIQYPCWLSQQDNLALREELGKCQTRLAEIRRSWSWRLTRPLRGIAFLWRKHKGRDRNT